MPQSSHNRDTSITYFVMILDVINRVEIGSSGPTRPIFCAMHFVIQEFRFPWNTSIFRFVCGRLDWSRQNQGIMATLGLWSTRNLLTFLAHRRILKLLNWTFRMLLISKIICFAPSRYRHSTFNNCFEITWSWHPLIVAQICSKGCSWYFTSYKQG